MPPKVNETAAVRIPAIGAVGLLATVITASAHVETVYDKPPIVAKDPPGVTTTFDGLPSELGGYPEMTATRGKGVIVSGLALRLEEVPDPRALLSARIRSIPYEGRDCPETTPPTGAAVDDALRFADHPPCRFAGASRLGCG